MTDDTITPGATLLVPYPFVRQVVTLLNEEGCEREELSWRPGAAAVDDGAGFYEDQPAFIADAMGARLLTVISTHKPGARYPERVFYTQQWRDPDGKQFGKGGLRIATRPQFARMLRGYRYEFEIEETECPTT